MGGQLILVYGLGGGRGHDLRSGALTAALLARGAPAHRFRPDAPLDAPALRDALSLALQEVELLVVDAHPRGLLGELDPRALPCRTLLLRRLHRHDPRQLGYDVIVDLEPHIDPVEGALAIGPVLPAQPEPAPPVDVALAPGDDKQLAGLFSRVARKLRGLSVHMGDDSGALFRRVQPRVVVGAAGYHLCYEAARAGAHHIAIPRPKRFDRQDLRAQHLCTLVESPHDLVRAVFELASAPRRASPIVVHDVERLADVVLRAAPRACEMTERSVQGAR